MVRQFVGDKDIFMLNSVVDIAGHQPREPAGALAGRAGDGGPRDLSRDRTPQPDDKPLVAATMFGVTTACVERARETLERAGCEVLVFHATGNGGQAMEALIGEGLIAGVLDITTTELADEHVGGFLSAGPDRLTAAGKAGIPQVVSDRRARHGELLRAESRSPPGSRTVCSTTHNANVTLMRTTPEENARIGAEHRAEAVGGEGAGRHPAPRARGVRDRQRGTAVRRSRRRARRCTTRSDSRPSSLSRRNDAEFADAAASNAPESDDAG